MLKLPCVQHGRFVWDDVVTQLKAATGKSWFTKEHCSRKFSDLTTKLRTAKVHCPLPISDASEAECKRVEETLRQLGRKRVTVRFHVLRDVCRYDELSPGLTGCECWPP